MSDFDLGRHEAMLDAVNSRLSRVEKAVSGFDAKLDTVLEHMAEKRGERKMLVMIATAAGGLSSFIIALAVKLWGNP